MYLVIKLHLIISILVCMYSHIEYVLFLYTDDGKELYHTKNDGKNYFDMTKLKKAENAVCRLSIM